MILHRAYFPICGASQVNGPRMFHSEIGMCIVLVDHTRAIVRQSDVEAIGRRHVRYSSR